MFHYLFRNPSSISRIQVNTHRDRLLRHCIVILFFFKKAFDENLCKGKDLLHSRRTSTFWGAGFRVRLSPGGGVRRLESTEGTRWRHTGSESSPWSITPPHLSRGPGKWRRDRGGDHAGVLGSSDPALSQKEEPEEGQRKSEVRSFT